MSSVVARVADDGGLPAGAFTSTTRGIPEADGRPLLRPLPIQHNRGDIPASARIGDPHPHPSDPRSSRPG